MTDINLDVTETPETAVEQPEAVVETSIDDTLVKALADIKGREDEQPTPEATKTDRQRNPNGTFTKTAVEKVDATLPPTAKPKYEPPSSLKAEVKAKWGEVPEWVQEEILRREEDSKKGLDKLYGELGDHAKFGQTLKQVITPHASLLQAQGVTPEVAIADLLNTASVLYNGTLQQKLAMYRQLGQKFGIPAESPEGDGNVLAQVQQYIAPVTQQVTQLQQALQRQEQERRQHEETAATENIQKFKSDPKHEHFELVRDDMAKLIQGGLAKTLDEAYETAVWSRADTRALLLARQAKEADDKRMTEHAAKAKEAQKHKPVKTSPTYVKPDGKRSIDDTLRETLKEMRERT